MRRLPGYDTRTSRAEAAAFAGLGLAAAGLMIFAICDGARFAGELDCIAEALSPTEVLTVQAHKNNETNQASMDGLVRQPCAPGVHPVIEVRAPVPRS